MFIRTIIIKSIFRLLIEFVPNGIKIQRFYDDRKKNQNNNTSV